MHRRHLTLLGLGLASLVLSGAARSAKPRPAAPGASAPAPGGSASSPAKGGHGRNPPTRGRNPPTKA